MKKLLFLWMITIVFLMVVATILVNTPIFIKNITYNFLKENNITYQKVDGDVLQGVSFYNIAYNKKPIASKMQFIWSPLSLLEKKVVVHKANIEDLNITNFVKFIKSFKIDNKQTGEKLDLTLILQKAQITTSKYSYRHYTFNSMQTEITNLSYDIYNNAFKSGEIVYKADMNYGNIDIYAKNIGEMEFKGKGSLSVNQLFYDRYHVPLIATNAGNANISEFYISKNGLTIFADTKGKKIFKDLNDTNNLDALQVNSKISYNWKTGNVIVDSKAVAKSFYAPKINIKNIVIVDKNKHTVYSGTVETDKIISLNPKLLKLLTSLKAKFTGDDKHLNVFLDTKDFNGVFSTNDFERGIIKANSKKQILLKEYLNLPKEFQNSMANLEIEVPIKFKQPYFDTFDAKVKSNIIDLEGKVTKNNQDWMFDTKVISIPSNSLLKSVYKYIKWDSFLDSNIKILFTKDEILADIKSLGLVSNIVYKNLSNAISGTFELSGLKGIIEGNANGNIVIKTDSSDIKASTNSLSKYIDFKPPNINGDGTIDMTVTKDGKIDLLFNSSNIILGDLSKDKKSIENLKAKLIVDKNKIILNEYSFVYDKMHFFSTKQSFLNLNNGNLKIDSFWINNQLSLTGNYNLNSKNGTIFINGTNVFVPHEYASVTLNANLKATISGNSTSINGNIVVTDGDILYYLGQKTFPTDSDIIILQEQKQKISSPLIDNLSMFIKINTIKPLRYKQEDSDIKATFDLTLQKNVGEKMMLLGLANIEKNGYYIYQDKKFILQPSSIYFTGDIYKPILNIQAVYKTPNHTIRAIITGIPSNPNINFTSTPKLTKEQILSLIMFDSEVEADKYTTDEMIKIMGGAVAKSLLLNMGVNFDHLVFGSDNSVEIGKKINRRTTLIYANDEVSKAKVRYEFNPNVEGVLSVSRESTSADIIYRKEFKNFKDLFNKYKEDNNATK